MSERDFWRLTLRQFNALVERLNFSRKTDEHKLAVLYSIMYAVQHKSKSKNEFIPFEPFDFMDKSEEIERQKNQESLKHEIVGYFKMLKTLS